MAVKRKFHVTYMVELVTGKLLAADGGRGLSRLLEFLSGNEKLSTSQWTRVAGEVKPFLLEQHPWLAEITLPKMSKEAAAEVILELVQKYGEFHMVFALHQEDEPERGDPLEDAEDLGFTGEATEF